MSTIYCRGRGTERSRKTIPEKSYKISERRAFSFFIIKSLIKNLTIYNYYNSTTILLM